MTTEQTSTPVETKETESITINLADLQNVVRVLDHACEQGAFKGWQVIEQVFTLRAKIANFVAASLPPEEAKPKAKPAAKATKAKVEGDVKAAPKAATKTAKPAPKAVAPKAETPATKAKKVAPVRKAVKQ